jgi:hypothetical protein
MLEPGNVPGLLEIIVKASVRLHLQIEILCLFNGDSKSWMVHSWTCRAWRVPD